MRKSVFEGGLRGTARPAFRRVHYEFIAHTISRMNMVGQRKFKFDRTFRGVSAVVFADAFRDVPGFDRARFLKACGYKE